jgi:hypothetical protein
MGKFTRSLGLKPLRFENRANRTGNKTSSIWAFGRATLKPLSTNVEQSSIKIIYAEYHLRKII